MLKSSFETVVAFSDRPRVLVKVELKKDYALAGSAPQKNMVPSRPCEEAHHGAALAAGKPIELFPIRG